MRKFKRDLAVIVMRGQDVHLGHCSLIDIAANYAERVLVFLGSAQEIGTQRNPYSVLTRRQMIKEIYPQENVIVKPLNDLTNEKDITPDWGKYVIDNIKNTMGKLPELMIYGNDEERQRWFAKEDISWVDIMVPRSIIPISGTQMRHLMLYDTQENREKWLEYHDESLHKMFYSLREELLAAPYYQDLYKIINKEK